MQFTNDRLQTVFIEDRDQRWFYGTVHSVCFIKVMFVPAIRVQEKYMGLIAQPGITTSGPPHDKRHAVEPACWCVHVAWHNCLIEQGGAGRRLFLLVCISFEIFYCWLRKKERTQLYLIPKAILALLWNGSFIKPFNRFKSNKIFCFTNRIFQKAISKHTAMRAASVATQAVLIVSLARLRAYGLVRFYRFFAGCTACDVKRHN